MKVDKELCFLSFTDVPLSVPPLLPLSTAGKDDNGEEDCSHERSKDDNYDGHGVSWRCGDGRETRSLTRTRRLGLYH